MRSHGDEAKYADLTLQPEVLPPGCTWRWAGRHLGDNFPVTITTSFLFADLSFEVIEVTLTAPDLCFNTFTNSSPVEIAQLLSVYTPS